MSDLLKLTKGHFYVPGSIISDITGDNALDSRDPAVALKYDTLRISLLVTSKGFSWASCLFVMPRALSGLSREGNRGC